MDKATAQVGRKVAASILERIGWACCAGNLVAVGSELLQIDRNLPQLERDEPARAPVVRAALGFVEERLAKRFGIDAAAARGAARRHAGVA